MPVSLFSPAKINLGLSIVGRRSDGFHLLESLFWPLSFGDSLEVREGNPELKMQWAELAPLTQRLPQANDNIITTLVNALIEEGYLESRPGITIKKNIPIGGGLGGGSSNAGTLIKYLISNQKLKKIPNNDWLSRFGADIPFFLESKPCWVTGVGETLQPLTLDTALTKSLHFLLVVLPFGCNTKDVFSHYRKSTLYFSASQVPFPDGNLTGPALLTYLSKAQNDLEAPAKLTQPLIGTVLDTLRSTPAFFASLSGSGSTCYAIYDSAVDRENSIKDLQSFFRVNGCKGITAETFAAH